MRFMITPFLVGVTVVHAQLRGSANPSPKLVVSSDHHPHENRDLMEGMMSGFMPLACNNDMQPCVNWSTQAFDPTSGVVTIPCGQCVTMDADSSSDLVLPNGLDIQGKLVFPDGYKITMRTPFVFVQGVLEMTSTRATSNEQDVKIILTGDDIQTLIPHPHNAQHCPESGCNVGNRPIAIAGGTLDIHGLQETCPTWKKLKNVIVDGVPENVNVPTYTPPPPSPSSTCSDVMIETDFENGQGVSYPSQWYRNYGGTESFESDDGGVSHYTRWSGRTATWHGPQTNFDPYCIVPGVEYFVTARVKLIGITGYTCLSLMSYMYDQGASPEKRWSGFGQACTSEDDTWFDFSAVKVFDELTANPLNPSSFARRLYWEKPPAGVDIALDDVKIFRLPSSAYPDTSSGNLCHELLLNGDGEDTSLHPLTYPYLARPGTAHTVQIGTEQDFFGETNHYFAVRNRKYGYDTPRPQLWTDCVQKDAIYSISLDLRVHSQVPKTFRVQLTVIQPDGSQSWPWLLVCPPAKIDDGWVHCSGSYQFKEADSTASRIDWYLVSDDDSTSDVDFDNFSMSFESGPISALVVEDDTGDIDSCWGASSEVLLTSSGLTFDDVKVATITGTSMNADGTTTLQLAEPIGSISFSDKEPDYGAEVALLSRNIQFESDNSLDSVKGGHLMVLHTPHVAQTLQGVALRKFGQAGNLGRYPVHFHMCGSVHGSLVSKNIVRESNQRCYVVHGSHNVTLHSNLAYDTHGHCFLLEDSGEMDNKFINNLAAVTRKATTLIRAEETDDFPSSFWVTNPMNSFLNNVAAGSEHSGFWFEMKSTVRAPTNGMSHELGQMNPSRLPLTQFEKNIAHSNHEHGFKTYPGTGYKPDGSPAVFKDLKSYRNRQSGVFIHNSRNIAIAGGIFADNRIGIDIDRSPTCSVTNATIIGLSPEYRTLSTSSYLHKHCPSSWPIRGLELHTFWNGGDISTGTRVEDTSFAHFGNSGCAGSTALRVDPENKGYFDIRTSLAGLSFDVDSEPLSSCDAVDATDEEMGPIDNVAIQDLDGSIMGSPGYIVTDNTRMTAFAPGCTSHPASCTAHCPGLCLRTMGFAVSNLEDDDLIIEIKDIDSGVTVSFTGEYDWPLNSDGSVNIAEHTKAWRNRRFFATLPSDGNYEARFVNKDGQTHWPLFVKTQYEDPNHDCPEFASFTVVEPEVEPGYCDELIRNGDISAGIENWLATTGGVATVDESASGQGLAITSEYRTASWMGPAQYLDTRCLVEGNTYRVSTKVKLIHKDTGAPLDCDSAGGKCPKFTMKIGDGAWENLNENWFGIGGRDNYWDASLEWNSFQYDLTITEEMANAGSALLYSEEYGNNLDALIVLDDVSVQKIV